MGRDRRGAGPRPEPPHFGTIHKWALGGPDPLDGYGVPAGEVIG
ncbi:hypothetical protein AB0L00_20060 [Actinoallomurus sp. NPDC052308]